MEMKRKTPLQLQALDKFYAEQKYPSHAVMKELASVLDLTFKQVKGWFIEKRRRDRSRDILITPPSLSKKVSFFKGRNCVDVLTTTRRNNCKKKRKEKKLIPRQTVLPASYILTKIFRKDGPSLGTEFDSLPSKGFQNSEDSRSSSYANQENQRANKKRKVSKQSISTCLDHNNSGPAIKHGMGKGLMTIWRATNPNGGNFPTGISFAEKEIVTQVPTPVPRKPQCRNRKRPSAAVMRHRRLNDKTHQKRKPCLKQREVESKKEEFHEHSPREKCELALKEMISQERINQFAMLADDEDLELRELQAGQNPHACSDHCATNSQHGCSLCKDLLPKFPPSCVRMKQPFAKQPWDSSPETGKKLFKVFHFLYTYSVDVDICPFTLDDFAQAFHDKDSLLLGKIHVALLKLLLTDVEKEMSSGCMPHLSVSCKFLALIHSVEDQEFLVEFWKKSLNPLTWIEILRQVLVAAGCGSRQGALRREALSKEMSVMVKYGLHPGTLKGELFKILSKRGNNGSKVPDLAKCLQIAELNLSRTTEEQTTEGLELLISSTLSSDITLFEKISPSVYRLRISTRSKEEEDCLSDTEDSGSVHDDFNSCGTCSSSSSDSEIESENPNSRKSKLFKSKKNMLTVQNEIDESHPGEVWLLGLMEGEYSDLCVEEKLNALVALIDLVSAGSSVRMEDATRTTVEPVPNTRHYGSGAKIKKSSSQQHSLPRPSWVHVGQLNATNEAYTLSSSRPFDSSVSFLKLNQTQNLSSQRKDAQGTEHESYLHPMQSIFLGSDRRYNRYWLFLGPCNSHDPGHRRVYFESSEDGHWEVIDTEEALRALLSVLDDRGTREAFLIESLEKKEVLLCQEMSTSVANDAENRQLRPSDHSEREIVREVSTSPVSDVDNNLNLTGITNDSSPLSGAIVLAAGKKEEDENRKRIRLQEFDAWIWNYFYCRLNAFKRTKRSYFESLTRCEICHDLFWRDEKHCRFCHTTFELDFDLEERYAIHSATCRHKGEHEMRKYKVLSSQLQSLKAAVHAIESAMPEDALLGAWTKSAHRLWIKRLRRTSSLAELWQVVADFIGGINEDWLCQYNVSQGSNNSLEEITAYFPTMPQTSSALALWLVKLDDLISPYLEKVEGENKQNDTTNHTGTQCSTVDLTLERSS
ncbi:homeobox-DDT domain protein RLT3 [Mercurialis annua]|uniref:homeobox-DDT domain protein RLT3 n=1 Tax=Mercurialis annua TaxID=3986 RepID=UPI00215E5669|nr:homeobox-DDT domain protein RLT3 [Mercurialis annua]